MIQIVIVKNPFNVSDRQVQGYDCGQSVSWYIQQATNALPEMQLAASINGRILDKAEWSSIYPVDGDCVAVCPIVQGSAFKSILRVVAMVAVMYYAGVAGKAFATPAGQWGVSSYLAAAAVQIVGGAIVNAILPPPKQQLPTYDSGSESATYGWNTPQSQLGQGGVWGRTYGTVMPSPQILSRHITSDDDKQYLNLLLCGGEGPVDSITNICIDNTPIENFEKIEVEFRNGTNDQIAIGNFSDTYAEQIIGSELIKDKPVIRTTDGNSGQGLEVTLECPNGLYYAADDGSLSDATVEVEVQYKKHGDDTDVWKNFKYGLTGGGVVARTNRGKAIFANVGAGSNVVQETWTMTCIKETSKYNKDLGTTYYASTFSVSGSISGRKADAIVGKFYDNGFIKFTINAGATGRVGDTYDIVMVPDSRYIITANKNTAVRKVCRIDNIPAGRYDVKCTCKNKSGITNRHSTRIYWSQLTQIGYEDFSRPNKVLVGIKALATDQLSGSTPNITWEQTVSKVHVWDPSIAAYVEKDATNPYWAAYDMIHGCKKLMNVNTGQYEYVVEGNPASRIIYEDFYQAASYADLKGLKLNLFYDSAITMWDALDQATVIGRGRILTRGTKYGCICDKPGTPVQLFTMGNIVRGSFKGSFTSKKDRAKAVEVSFFNSEKNYARDVAPYYGSDWDTTPEVLNPTQIERRGITTYEQAWREGEYLYKCNQYLLRSNTWEADVDAIACQIGDVVLLQHDIIKELTGQGGRIVNATSNTVTLDKTVTLKAGIGYAIKIRTINEDNETEEVLTASIPAAVNDRVTDTVTVSQEFAIIPERYDIYAFGEADKTVKPFKVVAITRTDDLICKINAVEYVEEIYTNSDAPPRSVSNSSSNPVEVVGVTLNEQTYRQSDGTIVSLLHCGWSLPRGTIADAFIVYYSTNGGVNWQLAERAYKTGAVFTVQQKQTYIVKICTARLFVISKGVTSEPIYITGKDTPPSNVSTIEANTDSADSTKILLSWAAVTDIDLRGYQVMEGSAVLTPNPISDTRYTYTATSSRQHTFYVRAVDNSGNVSEIPAAITKNITIEPAQVAGFSIAIQETDRSKLQLTWQANSEQDISFYEIRQGDNWSTAQIIATQLKATSFVHSLTTEGSQKFLIKAVNAAGIYSVIAAQQALQVILRPDAPTNLAAVQDSKDRSVLILNWAASPGKDIAGYELRRGTIWDTAEQIGSTRETFYRYMVSASASFTVMIRAKTVAGNLSNIANIPVTMVTEPSNVTSFSCVQSDTDKRVIKFTWTGISDQDFSYYEIREGTNWSTATSIATKIGSTYYDYKASTERTATYLIKAVNKSEKYSNDPAVSIITISLTPSRPGSGSVISDPGNRLKLQVSWDKIPDLDLDYYEVKYGSTVIATPKDTAISYTVAGGGPYAFIVRARNLAGFYSSVLSLGGSVVAEPSDIPVFTVAQRSLDRTILDFAWTAIADADFSYYEIRKGTNWSTATVVATKLKTAEYSAPAGSSGAVTYLIKAVNTAGYASVNAKAVALTLNFNPTQPANGSVIQDPKDKSVVVISWGNVTDADLLYYEIRRGTSWASGTKIFEGRETSYRYPITANGTYPFMICSKNVGGYYSSPVNLSVAATINPDDVTGFAAAQSMSNRSIITLHWNTPTDLDVSCYEIRMGATWDTAAVIGKRTTGTTYEFQLLDESVHSYFIKAISSAGYYSQNAAEIEGVFNLNPSPVSNIQIVQNPNDRSQLMINWTGIAESDLVFYELRTGYEWDTSTKIAETKETRWLHYIDSTGDVKIMIKSKNAADFYSDEVYERYYATVEPGPVTGFTAIQNGEFVELFWDKHAESDVVSYEISEGASFDMGQLVVSGVTTTEYKVKVDTERNYYYHIKAINKSLKYSISAVSAGLYVGNLPVKNVIEEYDEIILQSGVKTKVEFGPSLINWANMGDRFSNYPTTKFSDVGGQTVLKLAKNGVSYYASGTYQAETKDMKQVITANITADFRSTVILRGFGSAILQIRTSQDGTNWTAWQDFKPAQYTFRKLDARVLLATIDPTNTPEVNHLSLKIDVPDTEKAGTASDIRVGGTTVNYGHSYYSVPIVTPTAIGDNRFPVILNKAKTGFTVKITDRSGVDTGGVLDWRAKGY